MKRESALRPSVTAAAVLGLSLVFAGCAGGSDDAEVAGEAAPNEQEEAGADPEDPEAGEPEGGESEAAAPAGEQTEVEIGTTLEDPDMGDTVEIRTALRDFASEEEAEAIADGGEVVLLEVAVTPGEEGYGGLISMGNFEISWDDGADFWNNKTRMVADEMEDAGYTVLEDVSRGRDPGENVGWMAFVVDERQDGYLVQYERAGASVIGSDEEIDPFTEEFEIPAG